MKTKLPKHIDRIDQGNGLSWYETPEGLGTFSDVKSSDLRAIADDIDRRAEIKPKRKGHGK